ncbi:hypothetical protein K0M31_007714 [Melipona bicolor]|uniref:Uncharacterized protein n=1 Tax=Melipona bicolor TaxID=60889 RepID=A0AA40GBX1_9HYME|nr:hypothetical protein K0M31_007714 [Melipona bicolor]
MVLASVSHCGRVHSDLGLDTQTIGAREPTRVSVWLPNVETKFLAALIEQRLYRENWLAVRSMDLYGLWMNLDRMLGSRFPFGSVSLERCVLPEVEEEEGR